MDNANVLLVLVGGVNRFTELAKVQLERMGVAPELRRILLLIIALISGVVAVAAANPFVSVFTGTAFENVNPLLSTVLTGLAVGLGADAVHLVLDLVRSLSGKQQAEAVKAQVDSLAITPKQAQDAAIVQKVPIVSDAQVAQTVSDQLIQSIRGADTHG